MAWGLVRRRGRMAGTARAGLYYSLFPIAGVFARLLTTLDDDIAAHGVAGGALATLQRFDVPIRMAAAGETVARGPLLVVSNHPGLFDHFAVPAAIGRDDLIDRKSTRLNSSHI